MSLRSSIGSRTSTPSPFLVFVCHIHVSFCKSTKKVRHSVAEVGENVKFVQNKKEFSKSGQFFGFYAYLCHVIDEFQLLYISSTKVNEIPDMVET